MSKRLTLQEFIEKANQLHNYKYDYSETVYIDSRSKLTIICPEHGRFEQRASSHLLGNGCPECARIWTDEHKQNLQKSSRKSRGMTTNEWVERARGVHGDTYDYSQVVYINQKTRVKIICLKHGLFEQNPDSHLRGCGCRLCAYASGNQKGKHNWSEEQHIKTAETCMKKYGAKRYLDSDEGRRKIADIKSNKEFRDKMSRIISSDEVQEKTKSTCITKYGVDSAMKLPETVNMVGETKRKNHTWKTSKPEETMYVLLCEKFGCHDVIRQYKSVRYPYHCDFYIKSLDLFIELNATWLHGGHWFNDNDDNDVKILNEWLFKLESGKRFYSIAIDVWTRRDVKKRQTAIDNNLNYVVFWKNNLSDFIDWINSDVLVLNNIL